MTEQEILGFIGKFVLWVASGAGGAFLLLNFLGQRWIENRFAKDLELFKAQKLHEFDLLLTRKTKWHEVEHTVLAEAWKKLTKAHTTLKQAISMFRSHPDLSQMSEEEFNKFTQRNNFTENDLEYLNKNKSDLNSAYCKIMDNRALWDAHQAFLDFYTYYDENRIFLRPHIKEKFQKVDDHIWSAWVSRKMSLRYSDSKRDFDMEAFDEEKNKITPLIKEIEDVIQSELFPLNAKAAPPPSQDKKQEAT